MGIDVSDVYLVTVTAIRHERRNLGLLREGIVSGIPVCSPLTHDSEIYAT